VTLAIDKSAMKLNIDFTNTKKSKGRVKLEYSFKSSDNSWQNETTEEFDLEVEECMPKMFDCKTGIKKSEILKSTVATWSAQDFFILPKVCDSWIKNYTI
jgi:hypothetical protein